MMDREGQQRASTLIDPSSLATKPATQKMSTLGPQPLTRKNSLNVKPLLNFDDEPNAPPTRPGMPANTRSVFGVDTLWEREMAKLKEIQAQEERDKQEREAIEKEEEKKRLEKEKKKKKKKGKVAEEEEQQQRQTLVVPGQDELVMESRVSIDPPVLPNIERATRRAPPKPVASDGTSDSEDDDDDEAVAPQAPAAPVWHSSDEDEAGPTRTTGIGPRFKSIKKRRPSQPKLGADSDEEDLPLAATLHKVVARAGQSRYGGDDDSEDEDKPLSQVLLSKSTPSLHSNMNMLSLRPQNDSDEDDQPLGLRASTLFPATQSHHSHGNNHDEDDLPLALHPEQQRKTQYNMFAQQQQQQQIMMQMQQMQQMQQLQQMQMQSTMMMNAPMMSPGYFVPQPMNPLGMMPMMPPMPVPSPPPIPNEAKFGMVDRWRRDVVLDGSDKNT